MAMWLPGRDATTGPRVLVADDDAASRALLRVLLEREGALVDEAHDGRSTLTRVALAMPDLLLLDVNMPPPDGIEVARRLRLRHSDAELPIILVTGQTDTASKVAGLEAGASDFISKPYEASELVARVRAALRMRLAFDRLESAQSVLASLANAVDAKDPSTEHHCSRLAEGALQLARAASVEGEMLEAIGYGAVLHDVGKIGISEAVIGKQGPLDTRELAEMRRHPALGAGIVGPLRLGRLVAPIIRGHHERWDGLGYPDGLKGEAIPIGARVVAVVDAYDAMTHDRPYRRGMSADQACTELARHAGRQFDAALTELFLDEVMPADTRERPREAVGGDPVAVFTRGLIEEPVAR